MLRASFLGFYDFDGDGILDVLVGSLGQRTEITRYPIRIFKGNLKKGKLSYVLKTKLPEDKIYPSVSISVIDYNLDGHLDLYLANWYDKTNKERITPEGDRLFKGTGFEFKDISYVLKNEHNYDKENEVFPNFTPSFSVASCDVDLNGYPDLLVTSTSGYRNKLWLNLNDPEHDDRLFKDYGEESGFAGDTEGSYGLKSGGNTFFASCHDYNNDGLIDIYVGEVFHSYDSSKRDRSSVLTGENIYFPPRLNRTEYHLDDGSGHWSQGDRRGNWIDVDADGLTDLIVENSGFPPKSRMILFKQEKDHFFDSLGKDYGLDMLNPSGGVVIDYNRDGKQDYFVGQTKLRNSSLPGHLFAFVNEINNNNRSLKIYLRGKKSNWQGLGSRVILKTDKASRQSWHHPQAGAQPSQNEEGVYFGLSQENVKSLKVIWPYLGESGILKKNYDLSRLNLTRHSILTLCESGKILKGKHKNCL